MNGLFLSALFVVVSGAACSGCAPMMRSTRAGPATPAQSAELWEAPNDLADRNLFDGPWGKDLAPDPATRFTFVSKKTVGVSPGFAVTDDNGTEWSVKQGKEARAEVVMSRVLSAVGYHQPPVYYLSTWTIDGGGAAPQQAEARFRPKHTVLTDEGAWSWHQNPFIGTQPYNGLRVLMMILNESDLKDSNNSLYGVKMPGSAPDAAQRWYVVRDIGTALGETARLTPRRSDPDLFAKTSFIKGVHDGFVEFGYHGWHQDLISERIRPDEVRWGCELLSRLSDKQWDDAFRAGGYEPAVAAQFIETLKKRIRQGLAVSDAN